MLKHLLACAVAASMSLVAYCSANAQDAPPTWYTQAQRSMDHGQLDAAVALLQKEGQSATSSLESVRANMALAQIALSQQNVDDYNAYMAKLEELFKNDPEAHSQWLVPYQYLQAKAQTQQGELGAAQQTLQSLHRHLEKQNHRSARPWFGIVSFELAQLMQNDNSKARSYAEDAIAAFKDAKLPQNRGLALVLLGNLEWSRQKARRAYAVYDDAIRAFRQEAPASANVLQTQLLVAKRLASEGRRSSALERIGLAEQVLELLGTNPDLQALVEQAKAQIQVREP